MTLEQVREKINKGEYNFYKKDGLIANSYSKVDVDTLLEDLSRAMGLNQDHGDVLIWAFEKGAYLPLGDIVEIFVDYINMLKKEGDQV